MGRGASRPQLGPLEPGEEEGRKGAEMKVSGDLGKIKNKSPGASGLTPSAAGGFEVLGRTFNCPSRD